MEKREVLIDKHSSSVAQEPTEMCKCRSKGKRHDAAATAKTAKTIDWVTVVKIKQGREVAHVRGARYISPLTINGYIPQLTYKDLAYRI
jgi:hypothetical protein